MLGINNILASKQKGRMRTMTRLEELHLCHPNLFRHMERLKGITGFISILGNDHRLEVFKRYNHVMRVAQLTKYLCDKFPQYDDNEAMLVTYLHDINRLPFAHNLEKHIGFDQPTNLGKYCRFFSLNIPQKIITSTIAVLNKEVDGPSSSRIVYTADAALGFIEDPILAIVTLDVPPHFIPPEVVSFLGFEQETLLTGITRLKSYYVQNFDTFLERFNTFVIKWTIDFINRHSTANKLLTELSAFTEFRRILKEEFLRKQVFPINNERISHGSRLAEEVGIPYLHLLASRCDDPIMTLLTMTDQDLLTAAINENIINDPSPYYPSLP